MRPTLKAAAFILLIALPASASDEADTLCKPWGGLKEVISTSDQTSPVLGRELRLFVRCKDGSYVSRTRGVK